ncbi:MAG: hypothetical protein EOO50_04155 [Flavobacterium sp.]|uniref:beta strand repeat-containing protein n=1 Tax=Flavobacterium sp. TaxID=239 RepID=UPI00121253CA|nr:hypothetical protein [Flavobacterium sp.]RZJ67775.1 MAG: hypothetical protein EOO50_04155 [Flavobacterium sp.]
MRNFTLFVLLLTSTAFFGQVGVNTTTPNAMLDVNSTTNGFLVPRVALTANNVEAPIINPQGGALAISTLVYNTATVTGTNGVTPGYYYWSGTQWVTFGARNWDLSGNSGIATPVIPVTYGTTTIGAAENFLGTTDANDLVFGTNNIERMRIRQTNGFVGIGRANPATRLDILSPGNTIGLQILSGTNTQYTYLTLGRATEYAQIGAATTGTFFTDAIDGDMAVKNFNSGKLLLGANFFGNSAVSIANTGNVGVNTYTANSKLDVNGDLSLREGAAIAVISGANALTLTGEFSHYRLTGAAAAFSINSIANGDNGQMLTLINATGRSMTIINNNVANGILTGTGANLVSTSVNNSSVNLLYNATLARWVVTSNSGMFSSNEWHTNGNAALNDPVVPVTYGTSTIGAAENWAGTTDANDFVIGTNNIERLRVKQTNGFTGVGTASPTARFHAATLIPGGTTIYGENTFIGNADGVGVFGRAQNNPGYGYGGFLQGNYMSLYATTNATTYAGTAYGLYCTVNGSAGARYGSYLAVTGTAALNYGNANFSVNGATNVGSLSSAYGGSVNVGVQAFANLIQPNLGWFSLGATVATVNSGKGIEAGGQNIGIEARANADNANILDKMPGLFYVSNGGFPAIAAVGSIIDNVTYKIFGFGVVSTIVRDTNEKDRIMVAPEAPEALFQDYGTGTLVNGYAKITIDPILAKNIRVDETHPLKVFVQLEGDCKGVYVFNKTSSGFEVKELQNGTSSVAFTYQVVGVRADEERGGHLSKYSEMRFKPMNRELRPIERDEKSIRVDTDVRKPQLN